MGKILLINTGGTFSSRPGAHGLAPEITSADIVGLLGDSFMVPSIDAEDYCSLDSANILPEDWRNLANRIGTAVGNYDGIVIIHGTDTMAFTSSMLSFMLLNVPIPVVVTGSQLPLGAPLSDACSNLRCAMQIASGKAPGVYVVFDHRIILGCRASKVRTASYAAFESINFPYIGTFDAFGLHMNQKKIQGGQPFFPKTKFSERIAVLKLFPGMDPGVLRYYADHGYDGIFIEGFGLGGIPFLKKDFVKEVRRIIEADIPVLIGSQCRYEGSDPGIYETGRRILECGGIPVYDMTFEAVVTKLMWGLGRSKKVSDIRELFRKNLVGEIDIPLCQ